MTDGTVLREDFSNEFVHPRVIHVEMGFEYNKEGPR